MVTIEEQSQALSKRRQELEEAERQIKEFTIRQSRTQQELRGQTSAESGLQAREVRRTEEIARTETKKELLAELGVEFEKQKGYEAELKGVQQQVEAQERIIAQQKALQSQIDADINVATRLVMEGRSFAGETPKIKRLATQIQARGEYEASLRAYKAAGLKPITQGGKIVGFEDITKGTTISTEDLGGIDKVRLDVLERGGLITYEEVAPKGLPAATLPSVTTPLMPDDTKKYSVITPEGVMTSPYGLGAGGTGILTPLSTQQKQQFERAEAKYQKVVSAPLTFLSGQYDWQKKIAEKGKFKEQTDYFSLAQDKSYKELFLENPPSLLYKVSGDVGGKLSGVSETITTKLFNQAQPSEQQRRFGKEFLGVFVLGQAFSPFFRTGAVKTKTTFQKQITKTKFEELRRLLGRIEKDLLKKKSQGQQLKYLRELKTKYNLDNEAMRNLVKYLDEKHILKRQVGGFPILEQQEIPVVKDVTMGVKGIPQIKQSGKIVGLGGDKSSVFSQVDSQTPLQKQLSLLEEKQKQVSLLGLSSRQVTAQSQAQTTRQVSEQAEVLRLRQPSKQVLRSMLGFRTTQTTPQPQRQVIKQPQPQPQPQPEPTKLKTPKEIIGFSLGKSAKEKLIEEAEDVLEFFEVSGRRFGKDIEIGKFKSLPTAKKRLRGFLTGTLARSGFVSRQGKRVRVDFGKGFRPSKIEPLRVVQKRSFSLGSRGERKEIQRARKKRKKPTWF